MEEIREAVTDVIKTLFKVEVKPDLTRTEEQFGDYTTNVALQLAGQLQQDPRDIATQLSAEIQKKLEGITSDVSVAGPGFINIVLTNKSLWQAAKTDPALTLKGKTVVAEYSDPNPFKILHAGHLYTSIVGDAIANLLENAGAKVHRVNFGGDVGLHVGKTMWAVLEKLGGENPDKLKSIPEAKRSEWMAEAYIEGSTSYEDNKKATAEIVELNKRVYQLHADKDHKSPFAQIYWTLRQWSYDYFDQFYEAIGSKFERYYPESETADIGIEVVKKHIGKVFKESEGAVVFRGDNHGLHTRVFITKEGLPTYETKDVGLIMAKWRDYKFDRSVVITGNEQEQYMAVVLKAIEQFEPKLAQATTHLTHGMVKLGGGVKMSSRKGNILRAVDVLKEANKANKEVSDNDDPQIALAAVKYAFLKNRTGGDIIYDPKESVAVEGNSGPYLQYAHARARSILRKSKSHPKADEALEKDERSLLRKISEFSEVVDKATQDLMPHNVCTYLYELAQVFNRFYENNRVVGSDREGVRLALVKEYADKLKAGLELLNISAPDKM